MTTPKLKKFAIFLEKVLTYLKKYVILPNVVTK